MSADFMNYGQMVEAALRGVVREALERAAALGLPGNHHFYVTFRTNAPGVAIPQYLRERYPEEMTIVLQHQSHGLEVSDEGFGVTLSFNRVPERLAIPFAAMTAFADPSVQFGLQFRQSETANADATAPGAARPEAPAGGKSGAPGASDAPTAAAERQDTDEKPKPGGTVVTLDAFRKK